MLFCHNAMSLRKTSTKFRSLVFLYFHFDLSVLLLCPMRPVDWLLCRLCYVIVCCWKTVALQCNVASFLGQTPVFGLAFSVFLALGRFFAFLSDDATGVTAHDVMGECEMTECEAGCIRCLFVVLCPETACRFMTLFCELDGVAPLARQKQIDTLWFTSSTGQAERGCWVAFIPRYPVWFHA